MACMQLGSKSEQFHLEDHNWYCTAGLPSDVRIEIGEMSFHLHKFPLLSRSGYLEKLMEEACSKDDGVCVLQLDDIPGGAKAFELIAKFCYGVKIEVTALNVISLRCAAEYLKMNKDYGEGNLVVQTESFLDEVFGNWPDSIKALESCDVVLPHAEDLLLVSRCIDSLAVKACADPHLFGYPVTGPDSKLSPEKSSLWNGICPAATPPPIYDDWWYEDVSFLNLSLYKRLIQAIEVKGMKSEILSGSLIFYAKRYLPLMNRQSSFKDKSHANQGSTIPTPSEADQRVLLEEIVALLPKQKEVTSARFLLRLLRTAMVLHASPSCRENLEKRVGAQLDQVFLEDLLIPNIGYSVETLHDIDCVQRILDYFMSVDQASAVSSPCIVEEGQLARDSHALTPITSVSKLVDGYLAEVATDVNLKLPKFQALAATIPDYARPTNDGIYHAIDIFLKAHPWLNDSEREQLCRLLNCQKLSLEASTHAASNERLPLRVIVQVLFFEQLRLRTSISGWFFVSDTVENPRNVNGNLVLSKDEGNGQVAPANDQVMSVDDMRLRVSELEKECLGMKEEMKKLMKIKRSWSIFPRKCGFGARSQLPSSKEPQHYAIKERTSSGNGLQDQGSRELTN